MIYKKRLRKKVYFVNDSETEKFYFNNTQYLTYTNWKYKKVSIEKYGK